MKTVRMFSAGLTAILAIICVSSFGIGILNAISGAVTYGLYRAVASLIPCALFSILTFHLWPKASDKNANLKGEFDALQDSQSRGDFIASIAASKFRISSEKFDLSLTNDLRYAPSEVMDLWDDLAREFDINLSSDDFPSINSIEALRSHISSSSHQTEQ